MVGRPKTTDSYTVRRSKKPVRQHADLSLSQADFFLPPSCSVSWKPLGDQDRGPFISAGLWNWPPDCDRHICLCLLYSTSVIFLELKYGTSLVVQWLRIHLSMQGTGVQSLV